MLFESLMSAFAIMLLTYAMQTYFHIPTLLNDLGGINAFVVVFGTLYGIMTAFIVVEVWTQQNKTAHLFEKEAEELEKLYRLSLYFKNSSVNKAIKDAIDTYANILIESEFKHLGEQQKHTEEEKAFRNITHIIKEITSKSDHEQIVFDHIVNLYGQLAQTRIERTHQSILRLPFPLKLFFYTSTAIIVLTFVVMPFANMFYALFSAGSVVFLLTMISQIIEELDNPFSGFWRLTPKAFAETLRHIEESY